MADQNIHINYSVTDIERYLQGQMSAKEMHDMERAALQDPFLADAIEGYSEAPFEQSHQHLNDITALLHAEKNDAKIVVMPVKKFNWLSVAASVILIAGVGSVSWYLFSLNSNTANEKNIAQVTLEQKQSADTIFQPMSNDTAAIAQNYALSKNLQKKNRVPYKASDDNLNLTSTETIAPLAKSETLKVTDPENLDTGKNTPSVIQKEDIAATPVVSTQAPVSAKAKAQNLFATADSVANRNKSLQYFNNNLVNQFKGRVTDNNNQPVANAVINAADLRAVYTDASGYFALTAPDSLLNVTVSSLGFVPAQAEIRSNYSNNIAVLPDKQSLSEIVVTGYSTEKKALNKKAATDSLFPAGGWESFQDYVYRKLHKKSDSTNNGGTLTGDVEVEFLVREDGTPYNFNVVKSLNHANDAQAIDIIKNGPRWVGDRKNKKAKVTIPFQ